MFIPNATCYIRRVGTTYDNYGQRTYGSKTAIRFGLCKYNTLIDISTVRADASATRGNILEFHATGRILVPASVKPKWDDLLIVYGKVYRCKQIEPRYNVLGRLDHFQIDYEKAEDLFNDETA